MRDVEAFIPKPDRTRVGLGVLPAAALAQSRGARIAIHAYIGQRVLWHATVAASPPAHTRPIAAIGLWLVEVTDASGMCVWEWVCLRHTSHVQALRLRAEDRVEFIARVDRQLDGTYTLNRPTQLQRQG